VVKADHTVELRPVKIGLQTDEATVVRSGIKEGEIVVTDGQLRLVPGTKVESKSLGGTNREVAKAGPADPAHPSSPKS
jgi:membrane fusion protein, multidrug efflux system